jgi:DNA-directed RNA polymerase I, II, and III subunit RPABC2
MPIKPNKLIQEDSKEIIDVSKFNINKLSGGAKKKELDSEPEIDSSEDTSDESNIDEQVSSDDERDIDEETELEETEIEETELEETELEETDKETELEETDKETDADVDADEKTNIESDNESKDNEDDNEENIKDKCYQKFSKKSNMDTDIDYDEYFKKDEEIIINKTGRLTKPYLTKYEKVRILGDRSRQLAQGAKPMIKNTTGLSHKEVALLELKSKVIPLIIERPIPNVGVEKWKLSELEINL